MIVWSWPNVWAGCLDAACAWRCSCSMRLQRRSASSGSCIQGMLSNPAHVQVHSMVQKDDAGFVSRSQK